MTFKDNYGILKLAAIPECVERKITPSLNSSIHHVGFIFKILFERRDFHQVGDPFDFIHEIFWEKCLQKEEKNPEESTNNR